MAILLQLQRSSNFHRQFTRTAATTIFCRCFLSNFLQLLKLMCTWLPIRQTTIIDRLWWQACMNDACISQIFKLSPCPCDCPGWQTLLLILPALSVCHNKIWNQQLAQACPTMIKHLPSVKYYRARPLHELYALNQRTEKAWRWEGGSVACYPSVDSWL